MYSIVSNCANNFLFKLDPNKFKLNICLYIVELKVKNILIDEGPTGKRYMPRARGRVNQIVKRSSHITVIVSDGKES